MPGLGIMVTFMAGGAGGGGIVVLSARDDGLRPRDDERGPPRERFVLRGGMAVATRGFVNTRLDIYLRQGCRVELRTRRRRLHRPIGCGRGMS